MSLQAPPPYIVASRDGGASTTYLRADVPNPDPGERLPAYRNGELVGRATLRAFLGRGGVRAVAERDV